MKAEKAREIIERFPNLSKRELAKLLYKENPILFKDYEAARFAIRAVTGAVGNRKWKYEQSDKYIGRLPEGEKNDFSPFVLKGKRIGILSDIHIPYHDLEALGLALNHLKQSNVDTIVLNGDIIDAYHLSRWERDPNKRNHQQEIFLFLDFLDDIIDQFPGVKIVFKLGNHSERYERFIAQKAPEFLGFQLLSWKTILNTRFEKCKVCLGTGKILESEDCPDCEKGIVQHIAHRGISLVKGKRIIKAGKLNIVHGHEFGNSVFDPVNPARGFFLKSKSNVIGGHFHRTSEHIESDMDGKVLGAWSTGCLSDLHPDYRPINKWNLGFAMVDVHEDDFEVHNYKIINGKIR